MLTVNADKEKNGKEKEKKMSAGVKSSIVLTIISQTEKQDLKANTRRPRLLQ